jgi:hypothetical protein
MIRSIFIIALSTSTFTGIGQPTTKDITKRYAERIPLVGDSLIVHRDILSDSTNMLLFRRSENPFLEYTYRIPVYAIDERAPSDFIVKATPRQILAEYAVLSNSIAGHRIRFIKVGNKYRLASIHYYQHLKSGQEWICRQRFRLSGMNIKTVTLIDMKDSDCKTLGEPPWEEQQLLRSTDE